MVDVSFSHHRSLDGRSLNRCVHTKFSRFINVFLLKKFIYTRIEIIKREDDRFHCLTWSSSSSSSSWCLSQYADVDPGHGSSFRENKIDAPSRDYRDLLRSCPSNETMTLSVRLCLLCRSNTLFH